MCTIRATHLFVDLCLRASAVNVHLNLLVQYKTYIIITSLNRRTIALLLYKTPIHSLTISMFYDNVKFFYIFCFCHTISHKYGL